MENIATVVPAASPEKKKKNWRKIAAIVLAVLAVLAGAYFSFRQIARSILKDIVREQTEVNSTKNSETTVYDEKVLIYTDKNDSNARAISESELRAMSPEDREKALNSAVNAASNISSVTGISDSGSGSEFKPIVSDGIIAGVSTGTGVLINKSGADGARATSSTIGSAQGGMQDEIDRIRNGAK